MDDKVAGELLDHLMAFAELLERAWSNSSDAGTAMSREATTDALTGLPNRRAFEVALIASVNHAQQHGRQLSLAIFHLDDIEGVNDRFGRAVGDTVLAALGRRLLNASRQEEVIARIGGEEFGWILPDTTGLSATRAADRLRRLIADEPFEIAGHLSISGGVASIDDLDGIASREALLVGADQALSEAKQGGRNRVTRHRATPRTRT
jgi:diguanylate cyclase (GGDEF)-like protein